MSYIGTKKIKSVYIGTNKVKSVYVGTNKVYSSETIEPYLTFTATQDNSSVGYSITGTVDTSGIQYSRNMGRTWTNWNGTAISLNNGQKMYVRNTNNTLSTNSGNYFNFTMTGLISASGNIMSMINFSELTVYCYYRMFRNCSSLTTPPQLPATTLANGCYADMFYNCSSLTTAPQLPATTLAMYCYNRMFSYCSSLTTPPQLPATTLANGCYADMFYNCSSLTTAPQLPATTLANGCYADMFFGCSSLTTPPQLPATTLANNCYTYMFSYCSSLTTPPQLPATTLANNCYNGMFSGCISLQVNDTQTEQAPYEWRIPTNDTFANDITLKNVFTNCLGTRASNDLVATTGSYKVYYTQNQQI